MRKLPKLGAKDEAAMRRAAFELEKQFDSIAAFEAKMSWADNVIVTLLSQLGRKPGTCP